MKHIFYSLLEEEEAEEEARRSEVEANLLAEQQVGVAAVSAVTETEKRNLEKQLDHAGATEEEKQVCDTHSSMCVHAEAADAWTRGTTYVHALFVQPLFELPKPWVATT